MNNRIPVAAKLLAMTLTVCAFGGGCAKNEILGQADPLARGIDDGRIYPNVRTVSFGLDLRL